MPILELRAIFCLQLQVLFYFILGFNLNQKSVFVKFTALIQKWNNLEYG